MEKRKAVIFHIDVNSAFLSWEAVYRLCHLGGTVDLREQVSAVGGDMAMRHGIILAKSIPAKNVQKHLWRFCGSILLQWNSIRLMKLLWICPERRDSGEIR